MSDDKRLNPQITETDVGVRNLRKITIYPLALGDEIKLTETLSQAISTYFESVKTIEGISDVALIGFVVDLIKGNFKEIIGFVVDEGIDVRELMGDITNFQVAGIARIMYEKNFEEAAKNAGGLSEIVKKLFLSERPFPQSASDTDIPILPSTEPLSEEEVSPEES